MDKNRRHGFPGLSVTATLRGISSMATRELLAALVAADARPDRRVVIESVGGVDAARRVQAGEVFDVVMLAADAIVRLVGSGHLVACSRVDFARSPVAVAVRAGAARPPIDDEAAVRRAVQAAPRIGISTGPSGVQLVRLFERWGLAAELAPRLVQAPPGVPVAQLVAVGDVALGFQQLSELQGQEGVDLLGLLPPAIEIVTTFSGARCPGSALAGPAQDLLAYLASPATADIKRRCGMQPA